MRRLTEFRPSLLIAVLAITGAACTSTAPKSQSEVPSLQPSPCSADSIYLAVVNQDTEAIPWCTVELLSQAGLRTLGKTGNTGAICIRRDEFDFSEDQFVLLHSEGYFRGALSVKRDLAGFDERVIALARVALY